MKNIFNKKGFSTLLVVIIIGSVALALTLAMSTGSIWSLRGSYDAASANSAKSLANSCAEIALEMIRENNDYNGTGAVIINSSTCSYTVTSPDSITRSIIASSTVNNITRKLNITTESFNPLVVSSWQEVP